jgi:transposase
MSDHEADYVPVEANEDSPPARNLRRRSSGESAEVTARESSRKKARNQSSAAAWSTRLPNDLPSLVALKDPVDRLLRQQDYNEGLSLRVLRAALTLQEDWLVDCKKKGEGDRGKRIPKPNVRQTVCRLLGLSPVTYGNIMGRYLKQKEVYSSQNGGNTKAKQTRIPQTKSVQVGVREFVRSYRRQRMRVTARQVLDYFVDKELISVERDITGSYEKKWFATAYRSTRRWLQKNSYRRGARKGNIVFKPELEAERDYYLKEFFTNRLRCEQMHSVPVVQGLREVYLDESYIHHHYHRFDDSLWDPSDDQDVQVGKMKHKGSRYCFLAAIQGADPRVKDPVAKEAKGGLVPGSLWTFCPQAKKDSTGDYHKVFNSSNFIKWWKVQLLPNLHQPSLIMMDNAKYHKTYPADVPKISGARKARVQEYLEYRGLPYDASDTVAILKDIAGRYIKEHELQECSKLAAEQGHRVLFTPKYHSDMQPIELTWARIKGEVGRQYTNNTTLKQVYERLMVAFDRLEREGNASVEGMIRKAASIALTFYKEEQEDEPPGTLPNPHDEEGEGDEEQEDDELEEDVREDSDASGDEYGATAQV